MGPPSSTPTWNVNVHRSRMLYLLAGAVLLAACQDVPDTAPNVPPVADFDFECGTNSCSFTDGSTDLDGSIATYAWNFDDRTPVETARNPVHAYAPPGSRYNVTLTVTDDGGAEATVTKQLGIQINYPPLASFDASCVDLTCSFTDLSADRDGRLAGYRWDFGDGAEASTTRSPEHTYAAPGHFSVTLTVTDFSGATASKTSDVTVRAHTDTSPLAFVSVSCVELSCRFTGEAYDADGDVITSYAWAFGDGTSGSGGIVDHTYDEARSYDVQLTVTDGSGRTGQSSTEVTVPPPPPQSAAFAVDCDGPVCTFSNQSTPANELFATWDFGDGAASSEWSPTYRYNITEPTEFTVTLTVTDWFWELPTSTSKTITVQP